MMAVEPLPGPLGVWLDRHTASAPEALRRRVHEYAGEVASQPSLPAALAAAGDLALARVLAHAGDRSAALDLLAADALVTLALLAQAETAPEELEGFAERLLRMHLPGR
jgi:hypothetical protein